MTHNNIKDQTGKKLVKHNSTLQAELELKINKHDDKTR